LTTARADRTRRFHGRDPDYFPTLISDQLRSRASAIDII
jgi:hypothetical protein